MSRASRITILAIVVFATLVYALARHKRDFWDFEVYRTAGVRALHAEPLYRAADGHYQFKYWPAFAIAMAPFAALPEETGKVVWFALTIAALSGFIAGAIRLLPERRRSVTALTWWTLAVTAKFIIKELVNGQTNVLLGVVMVLTIAATARRRPLLAGVLVGVGAFVKPYAVIFLPWLLVANGPSATGAALGVIGLGLILPAAIYGWAGNVTLLTQWYDTVTTTTPDNLLLAENISFGTMWAKWIGIGSAASALAVATSLASLGVAAASWRRRSTVSNPAYLEVGFLLLLVPLLSPQGWDYVLIVAIPAFVLLIDRLSPGSDGQWPALSPLWRTLVIAGFCLTSATIYDLLGRTIYLWLMSVSTVTVGAILLVATLAHVRFRRLG